MALVGHKMRIAAFTDVLLPLLAVPRAIATAKPKRS